MRACEERRVSRKIRGSIHKELDLKTPGLNQHTRQDESDPFLSAAAGKLVRILQSREKFANAILRHVAGMTASRSYACLFSLRLQVCLAEASAFSQGNRGRRQDLHDLGPIWYHS